MTCLWCSRKIKVGVEIETNTYLCVDCHDDLAAYVRRLEEVPR